MKRTGPTNPSLQKLIMSLRKESGIQKAAVWRRIADDLAKPTRQRRAVNISRIALHTQPNDLIVVPGKVLGTGEINHSITIAAFAFSTTAKNQIAAANGKAISIEEFLKQKPNPKDIKIIG